MKLLPILAASILVGLAACAGGSQSSTTPSVQSTGSGATTLNISITIPNAGTAVAGANRAPAYISASTRSIAIAISHQSSGLSATGFPQTANVTSTSSGCMSTLLNTQCQLVYGIPPDAYNVSMSTYSGTGGSGSLLSSAQSIPVTIVEGTANSLPITLGGIPVAAKFVAVSGLGGSQGLGFTLGPSTTGTLAVYGVDAGGNVILGAGAPGIGLASDSGNTFVAGPTTSAPNTFTVTPTISGQVNVLTATITPTAATSSSAITKTVIVQDPNVPRIYTTNFSGSISVFARNGTVLAPPGGFPGLTSPQGIAYDPDNGLLYVATGNGAIKVFDTDGNLQTVTGTFPGASQFSAITYNPINGLLYATSFTSNAVYAYTASGALRGLPGSWTGINAPQSIAFNPQNGFLYVANQSGSVTAYDSNGNKQTLSGSNFSAVNEPLGVAYDSYIGYLYVTSVYPNQIVYFDNNGNSLGGWTAGFPSQPNGIAADPTTGSVYTTTNGGTILPFTSAGTALSTTFTGLSNPQGIIFVSPR